MQSLINQTLASAMRGAEIEQIAISANTTMLYLLLGLDTAPLGRAPFKPPLTDFGSLNIDRTTILPVVDAFIGADLVGGLALLHESGPGTLFVDLGTNGEMFVIDKAGRILATSCAMGPALEGMNISCGMTATPGAISHISHDWQYETIGGGAPAGLSGTGLIDLLANLLRHDIIDTTGRIRPDGQLPDQVRRMDHGLRLFDQISLSQADIRNFQLAKAASLCAAELLGLDQIDNVYIAGAFGQNLNLENFRRLRFLPALSGANWHYAGNTSLAAARSTLSEPGFYGHACELRDRIDTVNLSACPSFQQHFMQALAF